MNTRRAKHLKKVSAKLFNMLPSIENEIGEYVALEFSERYLTHRTIYRALKRRWASLPHRTKGAYTERVTLAELRKILDRTPTPPVPREAVKPSPASRRSTRDVPEVSKSKRSTAAASVRRILRTRGDR